MAESLTHSADERQEESKAPTELSIVLASESCPSHETKTDDERSKFLEVAQEIREKIYEFIRDDIQKNRLVAWNRNIVTNYDGLRFVCRQLYKETLHRIFYYTITSQQPVKLFTVPMNKVTFQEVRMLTIEINHNADSTVYTGFCEALNCLQLTIQELHILFVGEDCEGVRTRIHGCGNLTGWNDDSLEYQEPLLLSGQHIDQKRFGLYRQLSLMRQLRVLRIRNANFPLVQGMILVNKPHLKALSVVCDPRTVLHTYKTVPRHLLKGLVTVISDIPVIKALELTANAIVPASGTAIRLAQNLEHLTWIVPRFDYQQQAGSQLPYDFYEEVGALVHILSWRAPNLSALRLCISSREITGLQSLRTDRDLDVMAADFRLYLPRFRKLKHLEIHYASGKGFFQDSLISHLPPSLKRLYITDSTIAPLQLQRQIWRRYFQPLSMREEEVSERAGTPIDGGRCVKDCKSVTKPAHDVLTEDEAIIAVNEYGMVSYLAKVEIQQKRDTYSNMLICYRKLTLEDDNDCLIEADHFRGERDLRGDAIPLDAGRIGCLGCITYEYDCDCTEIEDGEGADCRPAHYNEWESDTTIILRLCGKLLDRERHLHLRYEPSLRVIEGIRPPQMPIVEDCVQDCEQKALPETAQYSCYAKICSAIYNEQDLKPKQSAVEENKNTLFDCLGENWYFGSEDEAMKVFELEPSAKVESQRPISMLDVVDSYRDNKCRWLSPDYALSPVGSFPAPTIPQNWQSQIYK